MNTRIYDYPCADKLLKVALFNFLLTVVLCSEVKQIKTQEEIFHQMFIRRRMEQIHAINNLRNLHDSVKQYKMLALISEKIFHIMKLCKDTLDQSGFIPGISKFPDEGPVREALSNLLENTALFCDLLIHVPQASVKVIEGKTDWRQILVYGIEFSYKSELVDDVTMRQLRDAAVRLADPYNFDEKDDQPKKKKPRKKLRRGPKLSSGGLNDEL